MNVDAFLKAILSQDRIAIQKYFHKNASIKWHCTNERFTLDDYLQANCEYPGNWDGEIERVEENGNILILAYRVFSIDRRSSFHAVSFIRTERGLIAEMDEYWSDDGVAPEWRRKLKIGKPIR